MAQYSHHTLHKPKLKSILDPHHETRRGISESGLDGQQRRQIGAMYAQLGLPSPIPWS